MYLQPSVNVCFVCKTCSKGFRELSNFIEHKKKKHFNEFQNIENSKCIIFDERSSNSDESLVTDDFLKSTVPNSVTITSIGSGYADKDNEYILSNNHHRTQASVPFPIVIKKEPDFDFNTNVDDCHFDTDYTSNLGSPGIDESCASSFDPFASIKCELEEPEEEIEEKVDLQLSISSSSNADSPSSSQFLPSHVFNKTNCSYILQNEQTQSQAMPTENVISKFITHQRHLPPRKARLHRNTDKNFIFPSWLHGTDSKDKNNRDGRNVVSETESASLKAWLQKQQSSLGSLTITSLNTKVKPKPKLFQQMQIHLQKPEPTFINETHPSQITNLDTKPLICGMCGLPFHSKITLTSHLLTHSKDKTNVKINVSDDTKVSVNVNLNARANANVNVNRSPNSNLHFKCPLPNCAKEFAKRKNYTKHLKITHSDFRPYKCRVCGKAFKVQNGVTKHMSVHSTERPFKCTEDIDNCKATFTRSYHLGEHIRRLHHKNDGMRGKKFSCDICHKTFFLRTDLLRHSVVHMKDKPFQCNNQGCKKQFKDLYASTRHQKIHHS